MISGDAFSPGRGAMIHLEVADFGISSSATAPGAFTFLAGPESFGLGHL